MVVLQPSQLYLASLDLTKDNIFLIPCKKKGENTHWDVIYLIESFRADL